MISALKEVAALRFSANSVNVDDLIIPTISEKSLIKNILPPLPPRVSTVHSSNFLN